MRGLSLALEVMADRAARWASTSSIARESITYRYRDTA